LVAGRHHDDHTASTSARIAVHTGEPPEAKLAVVPLGGDVLGAKFVEELLARTHRSRADGRRKRLPADCERLHAEVKNLVESIVWGVPAEAVAPDIRARHLEI